MCVEHKNVHFLKRGEQLGDAAKTGVSLHCHTLHSRELIDFIPYYAERIPVVSYLVRRERRRCEAEGRQMPDFKTGYWTPPLTGRGVFDLETEAMAGLGLESIVSITDHDTIGANLEIRDHLSHERAPISLEWTVPFENAFFHLGIHNLPAEQAEQMTAALLDYTATGPDDARLNELFGMLNDEPSVLVVFNHPIWDIEMIGQENHERALRRFVATHSRWLHAIEINGFRTWSENLEAMKLASGLGLPVVSGGDRHCLHSNTMLNLTDAESFEDFVDELRIERRSRIAVRPEYHLPLPSRQLASIAQILGSYDDFEEGRRTWPERVYFDSDGTGIKTLHEHWNGRPPMWTTAALLAVKLLAHPMMRPAIAALVGNVDIGRNDKAATSDELFIGPVTTAVQR